MIEVEKCIIGGGLAGLCAGLSAGTNSLIIEKDRLGGRSGSDFIEGVIFDYSLLYILSLNECSKKIFNEINAFEKLKKVNKKMLFYKNSKKYLLDFTDNFTIPSAFFENNLDFERFRRFISNFKTDYHRKPSSKSDCFEDCSSNESLLSFFRPVSETFYLCPFEKIPSQFLFSLFEKLFLKNNDILVCKGGFGKIIELLTKKYKGKIIFDKALKIRELKKGFEVATQNNKIVCNKVISAVPHPELNKLIDMPYKLTYVPAKVLMLKNNGPPINFYGSHMCFSSEIDSPVVFFNDISLRIAQKSSKQFLYALINPRFVKKKITPNAVTYLSSLLGQNLELIKEYYWDYALPSLNSKFIKLVNKQPNSEVKICGDSVGIGIKKVMASGYNVGFD